MLNLKKVLGAKPKEHVESKLRELPTPWGESLDFNHVLEQHPNPQFARKAHTILNGKWQCAFVESGHDPAANLESVVRQAAMPDTNAFDCDIVVPFSPEAPLSGVKRQLQPDELIWYRRNLHLESDDPLLHPTQSALLHFEAVDYACAVYVNGSLAGTHVGGYTPFAFDVGNLLEAGANEIAVCVADPSEFGGQLRGKQRFDRGDIWYTAQSGIWQSVWIEPVPLVYLQEAHIVPELDTGLLTIGARIAGLDNEQAPDYTLQLSVRVYDADGMLVASNSADADSSTCALAMQVPNVHAWSPEDPYLYTVAMRLGPDLVESYCGFRSVEVKRDASGVVRIFLNDAPLFIKGVLDQAYWSDGLMTAPADEAFVFDIESMKEAGFNLMRKHIKIESARWYYHCDRLGMLVLQDMLCGGDAEMRTWQWSYKPTLFKASWNRFGDTSVSHWDKLGSASETYRNEWISTCKETIEMLGNHPCIIGWSLFNEGWGQFNAKAADALVRSLDSTRIIDAVSGWYDQRCGDLKSVHNYFRELAVWPDRKNGRAFFVSEFGGFSHLVEGHSALDESYGYEVYDDIDEWKKSVRSLIAQMDALKDKGLAGYVYTQVSDIEEETNGILTYDRRINKLTSR